MNKLLAGAWIVFALDLVILLVMVRELFTAEFGEVDRDFAVSVTWTFAVWLCVVNAILVFGWLRGSRGGLWTAVVCGGLPLLWAWMMVVQAITDSASAPQ